MKGFAGVPNANQKNEESSLARQLRFFPVQEIDAGAGERPFSPSPSPNAAFILRVCSSSSSYFQSPKFQHVSKILLFPI